MAVTDPITATGYDDGLYDAVPLPQRAPLRWPAGATVAFYPIVLVEHYEEAPPEDAVVANDVFGGLGPGGPLRNPQVTRVGNRDYGHRVGFFRLVGMLEDLGITPVIAIDAMSIDRYPAITAWIADHSAEVVAHGLAVTRSITSRMSAEEERDYVAETKARIDGALSIETKGWLGPTSSESGRTLQVLADAGFRYCLDWPNDEQPYVFSTTPPMISLPPLAELADNNAINQRGLHNDRYCQLLIDAAEQLVVDGATSGRLLSFTLNPFTSGQPARSHYLRQALGHVMSLPGVWSTGPAAVAAAVEASAEAGRSA
jgi:peptidoglycan/xylan/chitin deacetylase (PgdA/CDA1 family)